MGLKNLGERRERQSKHSASGNRGSKEYKYVTITVPAMPVSSQFKYLLLPPVRKVFPDVPAIFSRAGIEVARDPELAVPDGKWDIVQKWKEKHGFTQDITWALNAESYDESDDPPTIIEKFFEQAEECGLMSDNRFTHKKVSVRQALEKLLPWRILRMPALVCAEKEVYKTRTLGDREYVDYTLKKIKSPTARHDYCNWQPVILDIDEKYAVYNKIQDALSEFAQENDVDKSTRQQPITFTLTKNDRGQTTVSDVEFGDRVPKELWADLLDPEDYPNFEKATEKIRLDDEQILELMVGSWWWQHVAKTYPDLAEMFEDALAEADAESEEDDDE